ncbi:MAG TPA: CoA-transferase, partial [Candidatus Dormibacteraeota bacterium]|nr:CoA-transferase [Candidatus Dormibacteraeota bacterium]
KVVSIGEAVTAVTQGCSVAIGGFLLHNKPSAFVRELVRTGVSDLHLYACPTSSYDADLLIGAGLVAETVIAMASFEYLGPAPRFTTAMLSGAVEMVECDEVTIAGGLLRDITESCGSSHRGDRVCWGW